MSKHNFFAKFFKKTSIFINSLLKKKLNKLNFIFEKEKFLTFLSFKRVFMFLSTLIVLTFSYLSIPNFYDTSNLINNIKNQLYRDLNINISLTEEFKDDEKRPNIVCDISKKVINKPFMGFNRAQFSVIEASVLVSRLRMLPIEKILQEIEYLKIGIKRTAGPRESQAWKWIEDKIQEFQKENMK